MTNQEHLSVFKHEAVEALQVQPGSWYIDATFGRGGHTRSILKQGGKVIALDCDQDAIAFGQQQFAQEIGNKELLLINQNFDRLQSVWQTIRDQENIPAVAGVLFDFGVSSPQLADADRGFSFQSNGPLDMRMDKRLGVQAKDLIAILPEKQLAELFWTYGGEDQSRRIARHLVQKRQETPFTTTQQLADAISRIKPKTGHLHPATKVFQALRIAVNSELDSIEQALPQSLEVVQRGGRVVTISFHEGEDRIAKKTFLDWQGKGYGNIVTKKAIQPTETELTENPRSRSARLRIFEKQT
jgi:16S rRNA (cytosine1402-N4)-methyltransferase